MQVNPQFKSVDLWEWLSSYTLSQKKRNFSSWIFPGAQGQGHVTLDHGKSACRFSKQFSKNRIQKYETVILLSFKDWAHLKFMIS